MEFGKIQQIENIDFDFKDTPEATLDILSTYQHIKRDFELYVGCPVWANKAWKGVIYPPKTPDKDMLYHYTRAFNCIELNVTHYQIPKPETIHRWREAAAEGFLFCPKIYQAISHRKKLRESREFTEIFCDRIVGLEEHLGITFLQMPPHFSINQIDNLIEYLELFPPAVPLALELRHPSWFDSQYVKEQHRLTEAMQQKGITFLMTDVAGRRDVLHHRLTTPVAVIRFIANDNPQSDTARMKAWIRRIAEWKAKGLQAAYFWVHQPDNMQAPKTAAEFIALANATLDTKIKLPLFYNTSDSLF
ncbi:MAG: DUF72 domain-containing protein [Bernardetiaceae bacterium]|nr:DUF72 domain-containing protein [Bernardetiaceae bacterium]